MPELAYKICSFCKGVNHDEAYKLKASNFSNVRVDIFGGSNNTPYMPPTPQGVVSTNKNYNVVICNGCLNAVTDNPIKPLIDVMETAKANDVEINANVNKA